MASALEAQDPRTGEALPLVPTTDASSVSQLVEKARAAQKAFQREGFAERRRRLERAARRLLERRAEGMAIVEAEIGKVHADALFTEALGPLDAVRGWVRVIEGAPAGTVSLNPLAFPRKSARIELLPRGVVGVLSPWNFPISGLYRSVIPALLTGNALVVKPSEYSPRSSRWFLETLAAELPENVLKIAYGGPEVGAALLESGIDACVFTGSSAVGARVEARAFELGIPCSAEMGGNDAAIVLEDADMERTVAGIVHWALQNAGQACGAIEVVYADSRVAADLAARLADACERLRPPVIVGGPGSLAPIALKKQLTLVEEHIRDAVERGARLLTGGTAEGQYMPPTVLADCTEEMRVVREETFGPVIPVVAVDGPADAIRRVNRGLYGLTASLWTRDIRRAENLADELDVGVVTINNHAFTGAIPDLPWSGRRSSGRGIANSAWSLLTFARPKAIAIDRNRGPEPFWVPFDDNLTELGETLSDLQLNRPGGALKLPMLLRRRMKTIKGFFGIK